LRRKTIGNSKKITSKKLTNGLQNNAERSSIYQKQYRAAAQKAKKLHQASLESNLLSRQEVNPTVVEEEEIFKYL
jgi:hypothetical protein